MGVFGGGVGGGEAVAWFVDFALFSSTSFFYLLVTQNSACVPVAFLLQNAFCIASTCFLYSCCIPKRLEHQFESVLAC